MTKGFFEHKSVKMSVFHLGRGLPKRQSRINFTAVREKLKNRLFSVNLKINESGGCSLTSFVITSQIPSHASRTNSHSGVIVRTSTSGYAGTTQKTSAYSGARFEKNEKFSIQRQDSKRMRNSASSGKIRKE